MPGRFLLFAIYRESITLDTTSLKRNPIMQNEPRRYQVTPSPRTRLILDRYERLTGKKKVRIISELLDEVVPVLEQMADAMEVVNSRPKQAQEQLKAFINTGQSQLKQLELEVDEAMKHPKARRFKKPK